LRCYTFGFTGQSYFGEQDEKFIFETILKPEGGSGFVNMDWFMGLMICDPDVELVSPELEATVTRRFGFALDGDTNIYGVSADGTTAEVTGNHDLVSTITTVYLKAVYNIGVDIEFYVNDTLIGTLLTNRPASPTAHFRCVKYIQTTDNVGKEAYDYFTRCRFSKA